MFIIEISILRVCTRYALAVVEAAITLVDFVLFGPCLFNLLLSVQPPILEKSSAPYHGVLFLLRICSQSLGQSSFTRSDGYHFGSGCVCYWLAWEHIFPRCGRNCFYVYGDRRFVSCACKSLIHLSCNMFKENNNVLLCDFISLASRKAVELHRPTITRNNNIRVAFLLRYV